MKNIFCALLIGLFSLTAFGQADKTAPKYDLTRPNPKTTAEINSMTRMQEGSEAWNTDTKTIYRYVDGQWTDTGETLTAEQIETLLDDYYGSEEWRTDTKNTQAETKQHVDAEYPDLEYTTGVTSNIQTQLNNLDGIKLDAADAFSEDYNDLTNKPSILTLDSSVNEINNPSPNSYEWILRHVWNSTTQGQFSMEYGTVNFRSTSVSSGAYTAFSSAPGFSLLEVYDGAASENYRFDGAYVDDDDVARKSDVDAAVAGAGSGLTDGDKGDITVSSSGSVWDIDSGVVSETELNTSVNNSLDLADSSVQPSDLSRNHVIKDKTADATLTATDQYDDGSVIMTVQTADTLTLTVPNRSASVNENYFFKVTNDNAQLNVAPDGGVTLSGDGFGSNTHFRINGRGDVDCIEITDGVFDCNGYNLTPFTPSSGSAPNDIEWTYDGVTQTEGNFQIFDGTSNPVVTFTVDDDDVGDTFTYTLGNCNQTGFEAELYAIDGGAGELTLEITVDFDNPNPAGNANNYYGVDVLVEDSFGNTYCENFYFEVIEIPNLYAEGDAADPNNETDSMSANWTGSTAYRTSQSTYASTGTYGILSGNVNNAGFSSTDIDITGLDSGATHTVQIDASQVQGTSGRIYIAEEGTTSTMSGVTASNPVNLSDTPGFNTYTFTIPTGKTGLRIRILHVDSNPANADTVIDAGEEFIAFDNIRVTEN